MLHTIHVDMNGSLLKYNLRMAQGTKWLQATYLEEEGEDKISTCPPPSPFD